MKEKIVNWLSKFLSYFNQDVEATKIYEKLKTYKQEN